jgi:outer membrane protein assembly factor BamB
LLALALLCAACGSPGVVNQPPPSGNVYIQGGALRASDGSARWSADLGIAPPLIAGGVAYVTAIAGDTVHQTAYARAVRLSDGARLWQTALPAAIEVGPDVLTQNGLLVVATDLVGTHLLGTLQLLAFHTTDGSVAWRSTPIAVVREPTVDTRVPFVSRVAFASGRVVALADAARDAAFAAAWNATDGSLAWRLPLPDASAYAGASTSIHVTGDVLTTAYQGTTGERFGRLDVATGTWVWADNAGSASLDLVTAGALVFSDSGTGTVTALRPHDGTTLWTRNLGAGMDRFLEAIAASDTTIYYRNYVLCPGATPAPTDNLLSQIGCPQFSALSLADGTLLWQHTLGLIPVYDATYSAYGDGILYYQYFYSDQQSGEHFVLLALRSADGSQLWSHATDGLFESMIAGPGAAYALARDPHGSCPSALVAISSHDGSQLWKRPYTPCPPHFIGGLSGFPWYVLG